MKTIEERALEWAKSVSPWTTMHDERRMQDYIKGATEQRAIDIEKFKQWFTKWWEMNEYLPLDVCLKSIEKAMEE